MDKEWNKMPEGRRCQVVLLDDRRLELVVQPRLVAGELMDLVASHCALKEKEFFGLAVLDETNHYLWLQMDRKVLDHDLPKQLHHSQAPLVIYFLIKFFVESITHLRDPQTVELYYLQTQCLVYKGLIEVDAETAFQLAAYALQVSHGDFTDENTCRQHLKKLPVLPVSTLQEHPTLSFCEDEVIQHYKKLQGQTRGLAIVNYMKIVEDNPTYGVHYFEMRDKRNIPWWLGVNWKGISQYDHADRKAPRKVFYWKLLENLYFRDRKFSVEVHDSKRMIHSMSSIPVGDEVRKPGEADAMLIAPHRPFAPSNVSVHVWFGKTQSLTKSIWQMAIAQHQFYLDRKQTLLKQVSKRSLSEIARDLSKSSMSLSMSTTSSSDLSHSGSALSLSAAGSHPDPESMSTSSSCNGAKQEMMSALRERKEVLESKLAEKSDELKMLCMQEAELTGELPPETPPVKPGEEPIQVRRRVGTAFTIPQNLINQLRPQEESQIASLELEYEIQKRITTAAQRLANEASSKRGLRKQHKQLWQQSSGKLKELEGRIDALKEQQLQLQSGGDTGGNNNKIIDDRGGGPPNKQKKKPRPIIDNKDSISLSSNEVPHQEAGPQSPLSPNSYRPPSALPFEERVEGGWGGRISPSNTYSNTLPKGTRHNHNTHRYPNQSHPNFMDPRSSHHNHPPYLNTSSSNDISSYAPYRNKYEPSLPWPAARGTLYNLPQQRTSQAFQSLENLGIGTGGMIPEDSGSCSGSSDYMCQLEVEYLPRRPSLDISTRNRWKDQEKNRFGSLDRRKPLVMTVPNRIESRSVDNLDSLEPEGQTTNNNNQLCSYSDVVDGASIGPTSTTSVTLLPNQIYPDVNSRSVSPIQRRTHNRMPPVLSHDVIHIGRAASAMGNYSSHGLTSSQSMFDAVPLIRASPTIPTKQYQSCTSLRTVSPTRVKMTTGKPPPSPRSSNTSIDSSRRPREKEWYETSLDSPVAQRKILKKPEVICTVNNDNNNKKQDMQKPPTPDAINNNITMKTPSPIPPALPKSPPLPSPKEGIESVVNTSYEAVLPFESPKNHLVVEVGKWQPYREVSKPFEMSDFYKYSTKYRKQKQDTNSEPTVKHLDNQFNHETKVAAIRTVSKPTSYSHQEALLLGEQRRNVRSEQQDIPSGNTGSTTRSLETSLNTSLNTSLKLDSVESQADAFSNEMLAWYQDKNAVYSTTLV